MSNPFVGEIRMFAGNFVPLNWAFCEGQELNISEYETLYQLIGTTYGGDGLTKFRLPDLRNRAPLGAGAGVGLTEAILGTATGSNGVTLGATEVPPHSHQVRGQNGSGSTKSPAGKLLARPAPSGGQFRPSGTTTMLAAGSVGTSGSGGGQPHENRQPYLTVSFIISLEGIYPSQF